MYKLVGSFGFTTNIGARSEIWKQGIRLRRIIHCSIQTANTSCMNRKPQINSTMAKTKRELLKLAPWRDTPQDGDNKFQDARLKVTSEPGTMPTMHVPGKVYNSETGGIGEDSLVEINPELRYCFQRNFQVNSLTSSFYLILHAYMMFILVCTCGRVCGVCVCVFAGLEKTFMVGSGELV